MAWYARKQWFALYLAAIGRHSPWALRDIIPYFWRRSARPRLVSSHFGAAKMADLGQRLRPELVAPPVRHKTKSGEGA